MKDIRHTARGSMRSSRYFFTLLLLYRRTLSKKTLGEKQKVTPSKRLYLCLKSTTCTPRTTIYYNNYQARDRAGCCTVGVCAHRFFPSSSSTHVSIIRLSLFSFQVDQVYANDYSEAAAHQPKKTGFLFGPILASLAIISTSHFVSLAVGLFVSWQTRVAMLRKHTKANAEILLKNIYRRNQKKLHFYRAKVYIYTYIRRLPIQ